MLLRELAPRDIRTRLLDEGLALKTGPFVFCVRTPIRRLTALLATLYADTPLASDADFVDFHVRVRLSRGPRRLYRAQSEFDLDGVVPFKPLAGQQALAMLEWGMNWCICNHSHHLLILHGAVLERNGGAMILPAPSGSGKSTLCAGMMHRGWRLLSDELILIDPVRGRAHPLCRPVSLKNQSISLIREFAPEAVMTAPIADTAKGNVAHLRPSAQSVARAAESVPIRWAVFPRFTPGSKTRLAAVPRADSFMALVDNAFNYSLLAERGFDTLADVVEGLDGYQLVYGDMEHAITTLNQRADARFS
ncbi:MAG: HprK-related kinase A [Pseudohongiellaceae bacterium]